MKSLSNRLRESERALARNTTHEIPVMAGFCRRLRDEIIEAANAIDKFELVEKHKRHAESLHPDNFRHTRPIPRNEK